MKNENRKENQFPPDTMCLFSSHFSPFIFIGGVILEHGFAKVLHVEMSINLGGGKVFMSEQLLNDTQVSTVMEQMRGKRMAQSVRADGLGDARFGAQTAHDGKNHSARKRTTISVDKCYVA